VGLGEYHRKRDFAVTPEPKGAARAGNGRSFVIQKHAATRLHYDFRLEHGGVLWSWAVPKGPSYDPKEKRLAVHVEDHPLDYGDFEGVIPKGQYGGGSVVVWDRGTWDPLGDPAKMLKKGHIEFELAGEKCTGRWHLVRTGPPKEGHENWLLFKAKDDAADPARDVVEDSPRSVKTGRSIEEVAADKDRVWSSKEGEKRRPKVRAVDVSGVTGAEEAAFPDRLAPELCTLVTEVPAGDGWIHEIKLDGYRAMIRVDRGKATIYSRNDNDWTKAYAPIAAHAASLACKQAWIDGEVVIFREDGTSDFQALQNALGAGRTDKLVFQAFDLPFLDGTDLRGATVLERKRVLAELLGRGPSGPIQLLDHVQGHGDAFFAQACKHRLEGTIAKRAASPYRSTRTKDWLKIKCVSREDFVIGGFTAPKGARKGVGALLIGTWDGGRLRYAGKVGTGFTETTIRQLVARLGPLVSDECPFSPTPPGAKLATWVRPELVAAVQFGERTSDGILRHPSFKGLREDTTVEATAEAPPRPEIKRVQGRKGGAEALVGAVRITNPDRVLWKDTGVTKAELAAYYAAFADQVLPHVANRPLSLFRCPAGIDPAAPVRGPKGCFFQKHASAGMPDGLHTVDVGEDEPYVWIDSVEGLLGLVQLGVLEIHPWGSRVDDLERPDRLIFDLDPDAGLAWERVAEAALAVRARLDALGLASWVKTTGGKGLHVVVPLVRRASWEEVKAFCAGVAEAMVADEPKKYTATAVKARRTGKVFVDWLRNTRGATAVAAFSTRARAGAPISVPIGWDQLGEPPVFELRSMRAGAADPWEGFDGARQALTKKRLAGG
jgi:bifunctional non-homologous end joining protein LigD